MPVVIYLHGNSSSRLEGLKIAPELLKRDINLFVLDFAGCGLSEGEYISLGWHERDEVRVVVDFLEKLPGVGKIGLWGRSMGAATALMFNHSDDRISACCYDSPFAEFTKLAKELCRKQIKIPNFVLDTALAFIRKTIQKKNELDIYKLQPLLFAGKTTTPGFFVHAMNDELIPLEHSLNIFEVYAGEKSLNVCEGTHNSNRQKHIIEKIGKFFSKYLRDQEDDLITTSSSSGKDQKN
jgi:dipeptidyl aminopeptidase/acylaminoacyl peptidase